MSIQKPEGVEVYEFTEGYPIGPFLGTVGELFEHLYSLKGRRTVVEMLGFRMDPPRKVTHLEPDRADRVVVFRGFNTTFAQFVVGKGYTVTYRFPSERYSELLQQLTQSKEEGEKEVNLDWVKRQSIEFNGKASYIELPLQITTDFKPRDSDVVTQADLLHLDKVTEELALMTKNTVEFVTRVAMKFGDTVQMKDHDLYLVFKGDPEFSKLNICLEKVYPKLPESGEQSVGDNPLKLEDWAHLPVNHLDMIRSIHSEMEFYNGRLNQKRATFNTPELAFLIPAFEKEVRSQMMASSHMLKMVYGFNMEHARMLVYKAASDIVKALETKGGEIALDLNSWIVWDYTDRKDPQRVVDDEVDFMKHYLNRYTDSVMEALYNVLLDTPHPHIKPFNKREVVDGNDGVAIGTILPVTRV